MDKIQRQIRINQFSFIFKMISVKKKEQSKNMLHCYVLARLPMNFQFQRKKGKFSQQQNTKLNQCHNWKRDQITKSNIFQRHDIERLTLSL